MVFGTYLSVDCIADRKILWYIPIFRGRVFVICRDFVACWIVSADHIPVNKEESR